MAGQDGRNGRDGTNGKNGADGNVNNNWLKESLDALWNKYDEMNRTLIELATTIKFIPSQRPRPCGELKAHLDDHKELKRTATDKLLGAIFDLGKLALVALITWYLTHK